MTKVMLNIKKDNIYFDCENHCNNKILCNSVSTLCNTLMAATERAGFEVDIYEKGHVRIYIPKPKETTQEVFYSVLEVFKELENQNEGEIKLY